ncbi:MAG: tRNA (guanosine(37)-N1)-methyltransferase TrmD [Erysipelotrichaceae bacterium]|nr:tRNA (guanosine(37)-N1)-methyltransferase TrmD [Erysipelotrichaceae bacterium]MDD4643119.1 tRNA (guanosine(37)-N1)-methyltransferase TrmD [Erysipelotrichaceae bacterium]
MKISILTIFDEMFDGFLNTSIIKKARLKDLITYEIVNIRDFTNDKHKRVDDYPFGGGQGMVMFVQPIVDALASTKTSNCHTILMTPAAKVFDQKKARELATYDHLIIICAHYEGYDERILNYVDEVISIGDFILTGGELAAMVVSDAVTRLIDGVITEDSHLYESFEDGLLEYPQYTRPTAYDGYSVPEVLLSGHHENIRQYRLKESLRKTYIYRKDLLENKELDTKSEALLNEVITEENDKN